MAYIAAAQYTITDTNDPIVSASEPESPIVGMLWLDTSSESGDILKRWDGEKWVEAGATKDETQDIRETISRYKATIDSLGESINMKVWQKDIDVKLTGQATEEFVKQYFETNITQTSKDIEFTFEQSKNYTNNSINGVKSDVDTIKSYQRFTDDGIELGKSDSPFIAKLGNTKLSFLQDGVEIAYISNNKLYITEAQVTDKLSIGNDSNGYFEWVTTKNGLGLKRRVTT